MLVIILVSYLKEQRYWIILGIIVPVFINIYFLYLVGSRLYLNDLIYLDVILVVAEIVIFVYRYQKFKQVLLLQRNNKFITSQELANYLPQSVLSIIEGNSHHYSNEIDHLNSQIQELADYISRWSHEAKLPIASLRLMNERNSDNILKKEMRLTIERIQLLLNTMLMSSKLRNPENDIKIEKVFLSQVIKESIKHQSYFLINDHFTIDLKIENEFVYSDRRWLTYMLDQFITNSIKYHQDNPTLSFRITKEGKNMVLEIEDNGIGIAKDDVAYIFDCGFTGHNLRDGDYRSTGMGLYFVREIATKLGIEVSLDENFSHGSRFRLKFINNAEYFMLDN